MLRLINTRSVRINLFLVLVLTIALGASLTANLICHDTAYAADQKVTTQQRAVLYDLQDAFTSLSDQLLPSVVSITSEKMVSTKQQMIDPDDNGPGGIPFPFPFPGMPEGPGGKQQATSFGSGVIVRNDGYILTNDHVVADADKVTVTLNDGRKFVGKVSRDQRSDLAIIKIDARNLPAAKLGDSSKVKVGSWAIAIGSPFELPQTFTVGVISATGRNEAVSDGSQTRGYFNLIQTDASINPGNSGGPLINIDGEVVGINTLIRSSFGGGNVGIGFAIPVNTAKFVLDQLITTGKVTRGYLGLVPADVTPKIADSYGVKEGAMVKSVEVGSPSDKAGIQVEDIITNFDGKKITNENSLRDIISSTSPGKEVNVVLVRDKAQKTIKLKVGEAPGQEASASSTEESGTKLGFTVANITPELAEKFKLDDSAKGVVVTQVASGSAAMREGLQPGLLIAKANGKAVKSVSDFNATTKNLKSGDTLTLVVQTKQRSVLVELELD